MTLTTSSFHSFFEQSHPPTSTSRFVRYIIATQFAGYVGVNPEIVCRVGRSSPRRIEMRVHIERMEHLAKVYRQAGTRYYLVSSNTVGTYAPRTPNSGSHIQRDSDVARCDRP